jgi:hypothetical protein
MKTNTIFLPNEDGSQTLIVGPSGQSKSMLDDLTPTEQSALNHWSASQSGDPERGGVIDLMQWPGWEGVLSRRFKNRFGVDMPTGSTGITK